MATASKASTLQVQNEARNSAHRFIQLADGASSADEAAKWSLAAKNSIQVVLACEQTILTKNGGRR